MVILETTGISISVYNQSFVELTILLTLLAMLVTLVFDVFFWYVFHFTDLCCVYRIFHVVSRIFRVQAPLFE